MARLVFTVNSDFGSWQAGEYGPFTDTVEIDDAPEALVDAASAAHGAGVIEVTEGLDESAYQSQEDGEAAYAAAQGEWVERTWRPDGTAEPGYWSGPWHVGNLAQHDLEKAQRKLAEGIAAGDADAQSVFDLEHAAIMERLGVES